MRWEKRRRKKGTNDPLPATDWMVLPSRHCNPTVDNFSGDKADRCAKISRVPGTITREFLNLLFTRSMVLYTDFETYTDFRDNPEMAQMKLQDIEGFDG